jgi:thiamine biosynthesis protein ThiI
MADARRIGTYDISIQAHADCCTVFMPRMPATHSNVAQVEAGEAELDIPALVEQSLATLEYRDYRSVAYGKRADLRGAVSGPAGAGNAGSAAGSPVLES